MNDESEHDDDLSSSVQTPPLIDTPEIQQMQARLREQSAIFTSDDLRLLDTRFSYATAHFDAENFEEAADLFYELQESLEQICGKGCIEAFPARLWAAKSYIKSGYYKEDGLYILQELLRDQISVMDIDHPSTLESRYELLQTQVLSFWGFELRDAYDEYFDKIIDLVKSERLKIESNSHDIGDFNLSSKLLDTSNAMDDEDGKWLSQEEELTHSIRELLQTQIKISGPSSNQVSETRLLLAVFLLLNKRFNEARDEYLELLKYEVSPDLHSTENIQAGLAISLLGLGEYKQAQEILQEVLNNSTVPELTESIRMYLLVAAYYEQEFDLVLHQISESKSRDRNYFNYWLLCTHIEAKDFSKAKALAVNLKIVDKSPDEISLQNALDELSSLDLPLIDPVELSPYEYFEMLSELIRLFESIKNNAKPN